MNFKKMNMYWSTLGVFPHSLRASIMVSIAARADKDGSTREDETCEDVGQS